MCSSHLQLYVRLFLGVCDMVLLELCCQKRVIDFDSDFENNLVVQFKKKKFFPHSLSLTFHFMALLLILKKVTVQSFGRRAGFVQCQGQTLVC